MQLLEYFGFDAIHLAAHDAVGIEIESEGANCTRLRSLGWDNKRDGSLRGEGIELISPPVRVTKAYSLLDQLEKDIKKLVDGEVMKWEPSERCGVHVHINCQSLEIEDVFKIIVCYFILEDLLVQYCGPSREGNLFCLRARDADWQIMQLCKALERGDLRPLVDRQMRYSALNTASLASFGTLEFRSLQTPKDVRTIKEWVGMLQELKTNAVKFSSLKEIVEQTSFLGSVAFVRQVMGDYADHLLCPGVDELVMEGVRRVQDVAYTPTQLFDAPKPKRPGPDQFFWEHRPMPRMEMRPVVMDPAVRIRQPDQDRVDEMRRQMRAAHRAAVDGMQERNG